MLNIGGVIDGYVTNNSHVGTIGRRETTFCAVEMQVVNTMYKRHRTYEQQAKNRHISSEINKDIRIETLLCSALPTFILALTIDSIFFFDSRFYCRKGGLLR